MPIPRIEGKQLCKTAWAGGKECQWIPSKLTLMQTHFTLENTMYNESWYSTILIPFLLSITIYWCYNFIKRLILLAAYWNDNWQLLTRITLTRVCYIKVDFIVKVNKQSTLIDVPCY